MALGGIFRRGDFRYVIENEAFRANHSECSDRVRIFRGQNKKLILNANIIDPNLAKVGVEGSNPFARSNDFNALVDRAFAAELSLPGFRFVGVLIGTVAQKWWEFSA